MRRLFIAVAVVAATLGFVGTGGAAHAALPGGCTVTGNQLVEPASCQYVTAGGSEPYAAALFGGFSITYTRPNGDPYTITSLQHRYKTDTFKPLAGTIVTATLHAGATGVLAVGTVPVQAPAGPAPQMVVAVSGALEPTNAAGPGCYDDSGMYAVPGFSYVGGAAGAGPGASAFVGTVSACHVQSGQLVAGVACANGWGITFTLNAVGGGQLVAELQGTGAHVSEATGIFEGVASHATFVGYDGLRLGGCLPSPNFGGVLVLSF
jgi:hypothetical protein